MTTPTLPDHTTIHFSKCPTFSDIREISKEYYVLMIAHSEGVYAIVPELTGNSKINYSIL